MNSRALSVAGHGRISSATPRYYLGRPAGMWIDAENRQRRGRRHASAVAAR